MDYFEDRLAGRRIYWCPGGEGSIDLFISVGLSPLTTSCIAGYIAYCPQPTHPDDYTYCCNYYYLGKDLPSCCRYPWHTGALIALFFASIVAILCELAVWAINNRPGISRLTSVFVFLSCWCCPWCPLAKRLVDQHCEREEEEAIRGEEGGIDSNAALLHPAQQANGSSPVRNRVSTNV